MQDAGLAAADGASEAATLANVDLSAVVSTSVVIGVIGNDSIMMPAFTTVDTTRLADGFVNKAFRVRVQRRPWQHRRICGLAHAQDGTEVVVVLHESDGMYTAHTIANVRASLRGGQPPARGVYDDELAVLRLRAQLANHAVTYAVAQPDLAQPDMPGNPRTLLREVRRYCATPSLACAHSMHTHMHMHMHTYICTCACTCDP
jgi:hypothetical protein